MNASDRKPYVAPALESLSVTETHDIGIGIGVGVGIGLPGLGS